MSEFLIKFATVFFLLTLVSERIANFIKLYFQDKYIYLPFYNPYEEKKPFWKRLFLKVKIEILSIKSHNNKLEKKRELRILTINLIIGIVVAVIMNANLFEIIDEINKAAVGGGEFNISPNYKISGNEFWIFGIYLFTLIWWFSLVLFIDLDEYKKKVLPTHYGKEYDIESRGLMRKKMGFGTFFIISFVLVFIVFPIVCFFTLDEEIATNGFSHVFGYIISGFLISLGSKFWHDLLDLLFKIKNTKQILSEKETFDNYDSADQIESLFNTNRPEIINHFREKYADKLFDIEGVVSVGIISVIDNNSELYKKVLEIEYTTPEAQDELMGIIRNGFIEIEANTYYLKDYTKLTFTEDIIALMPDEANAISGMDKLPEICVFVGPDFETPIRFGSFFVTKEETKYFAHTCSHVLLSPKELNNFRDNQKFDYQSNTVRFKVPEGLIEPINFDTISLKFNQSQDIIESDYVKIEVNKGLYELYNKHIKLSPDKVSCKMHGGVSDYVEFERNRYRTTAMINYGGFTKKLDLYKIKLKPKNKIRPGDSGSKLVTLTKHGKTEQYILIAKSDNYAYVAELSF